VLAFATGLDHPRNLLVLPNGDVLVAETNAPHRPQDMPGARGFVIRRVMAGAGAGVPSANRITLLRDANGDGMAEERFVFLEGLNSPYGMAIISDSLFIAETDGIRRFALPVWPDANQRRGQPPHAISRRADQPSLDQKPRNKAEWLLPLCEHRLQQQCCGERIGGRGEPCPDLAGDTRTGAHRPFATGLRNPNGLAFASGATPTLWTAVNERDEIGSDLVPDYMTSVRDGAFYGWPFSYFGQHLDPRA